MDRDDRFDVRVARLEEHLVAPTAEDWLMRAEEALARSDEMGRAIAGHALAFAKSARSGEEANDAR